MKPIQLLKTTIICAVLAHLNACSTQNELGKTGKEVAGLISKDYQTVTFKASDGLDVVGNLYKIDATSPIIVLCHQAQFNKFEYEGVAQRLNKLGFNCLAIDQRSGGPIASAQNETHLNAIKQGLEVSYLNAIPDIKAAITYAHKSFKQEVILWGSSYSSTLVLWESLHNDKVKAVVSFSPGDYFTELGSLTDSLSQLKKPLFITSADFEVEGINELLSKTTLGDQQTHFAPEPNGHHGSRALWPNQTGGEQYWQAVSKWLEGVK